MLSNFCKFKSIVAHTKNLVNWKFIHIVFCASSDHRSKITQNELLEKIYEGNEKMSLGQFKTYFLVFEPNTFLLEELSQICRVYDGFYELREVTKLSFEDELKGIMANEGLVSKQSLL